jgi:cytochrome b involved in lipid metabolism
MSSLRKRQLLVSCELKDKTIIKTLQLNMSSIKTYTKAEVAAHCTKDDCWLIIGNASNGGKKVYDVTKFLEDHPGGEGVILDLAGKDADDMFEYVGHGSYAYSLLEKYFIGMLDESE